MKLSIVVPVYNVEKYLSKCLDSLLDQNIQNDQYEIIVVNDGSTDSSGDIAKCYADSNSNITLINQENKGLSGARNTGIDAASGEYVWFVDSDDFIERNILNGLVRKMRDDDLDVLRFDYQNINEEGVIVYPNKNPKRHSDYSDSITNGSDFLANRLGLACYVCMFIIKTTLLKHNSIYFTEGIYFEDSEWTPRVLYAAPRVSSTTQVVYNYLVREGSITQPKTEAQKVKIIEDKIFVISEMIKQNRNHYNLWYDRFVTFSTINTLQYIAINSKWKYIKLLTNTKVLPVRNNMDGKTSMRIYAKLINLSPYLFCYLYHIIAKLR